MISLIMLLLAVHTTSHDEVAAHAAQDLVARSSTTGGGFALSSNQSVLCPAETSECLGTFCCPKYLTCFNGSGQGALDNICCPGSEDCLDSLRSNPVCADPGWSLWTAGTHLVNSAVDSFCCIPGLVGINTAGCVAPNGTDGYPLAKLVSEAPEPTPGNPNNIALPSPATTTSSFYVYPVSTGPATSPSAPNGPPVGNGPQKSASTMVVFNMFPASAIIVFVFIFLRW